jgi:hypothetical protein
MKWIRLACALASGLGLAAALPAAAQDAGWTVNPLGDYNGQSLYGADINNRGQVIANTTLIGGGTSVLFSGGLRTVLPEAGLTRAIRINNAGTVLGTQYRTSESSRTFTFANGGLTLLSAPDEIRGNAVDLNERGDVLMSSTNRTGYSSWLFDSSGRGSQLTAPGWSVVTGRQLNDSGQVLGTATRFDQWATADVVMHNGTMRELGNASLVEQGFVLNNRGQVGGIYWPENAPNSNRAAIFEPDGSITTMPTQSYIQETTLLNDRGQAVVHTLSMYYGSTSTVPTAHFYDGGVLTELDAGMGPGTMAVDLNELGQVLFSHRSSNDLFLWDHGVVTSLTGLLREQMPAGTTFGLSSESAGINDVGQILVNVQVGDTWSPYVITPVPEPEVMALMLAGLGMLALRRRRDV